MPCRTGARDPATSGQRRVIPVMPRRANPGRAPPAHRRPCALSCASPCMTRVWTQLTAHATLQPTRAPSLAHAAGIAPPMRAVVRAHPRVHDAHLGAVCRVHAALQPTRAPSLARRRHTAAHARCRPRTPTRARRAFGRSLPRPRRFAANPRPVFGARRPIKRSAALIHSTALIWYNVNALKRTWKEARICR